VRDEADQARYIVDWILESREEGALLKQQAVLFRTSSHSWPLEVDLTRRNIPLVKFGGLKFLDPAHVKDLLALLRFVENPGDRSPGSAWCTYCRVLVLLPRSASSITWQRPPIRSARFLPSPRRAPATTRRTFVETIGNLRYREWPSDLERVRLWYERMNHTSTVSRMTPRFGAPTSFNSSRSPAHRIAARRRSPWAFQL
jgi:DNA helicase-2/ATP-dependent DNA helicase PcrA